MGEYLCSQVKRWLRKDDDFKTNGKDDIKIAFLYSQCGGEWTPVNSGDSLKTPLYVKESLCCKNDGEKSNCEDNEN